MQTTFWKLTLFKWSQCCGDCKIKQKKKIQLLCLRQNNHRRPFHKLFAITCVDYTDKKHMLRYFSELWHHPFSVNSHFGSRAVLESFLAVTESEAAKRPGQVTDPSQDTHKLFTHTLTPSGNSECPINPFLHLLLSAKLLEPQPTFIPVLHL